MSTHEESGIPMTWEQAISVRKRRLRATARTITEICDAGRRAVNNSDLITTFQAQLSSLERYYRKYENLWEEIEAIYVSNDQGDAFPTESEQASFDLTSKHYVEAKRIGIEVQEPTRPSTSSRPPALEITTNESFSSNHLPKMSLPKFSGDMKEWPKFRDTFVSLIHDDGTIPDIRKYHYLVTSLSGPPLSVVSSLPLTSDNYRVAWKSLLDAYDNKRLLAATYLDSLLDFKPLSGKLSANGINLFLTQVSESMAALRLLKIEDEASFILYYLAARCFSPETREQFELTKDDKSFPKYEELESFLRKRMHALQLSGQKSPDSSSYSTLKDSARRIPARSTKSVTLLAQDKENKQTEGCFVCKEAHPIPYCPRFLSSSSDHRLKIIQGWKGCRNCLRPGHPTPECSSKMNCRFCNKRHHSYLHIFKPDTASASSTPKVSSPMTPKVTLSSRQLDKPSTVLLGTAIAEVVSSTGERLSVRGVIDSGSQSTFITTDLARSLGLDVLSEKSEISGIGGLSCKIRGKTSCFLVPKGANSPKLRLEPIVVDNITTLLPTIPISKTQEFEKYCLADPTFHKPQPIQLLLGADIYLDIVSAGPAIPLSNGAKLLPSILGYIVIGKIFPACPTGKTVSCVAKIDNNEQLTNTLQKFWELEDLGDSDWKESPEEKQAERHFATTHCRSPDGRYMVKLPFKTACPHFPGSDTTAMKRFMSLETKLCRDEALRKNYVDFMSEYAELRHMTPTGCPSKFILPHHAVMKDGKIRVVFDGSSKTRNMSLNDALMVGPKLQREIWQILLNFRRFPIVFVADIIKMYRQILLHPDDRCYQHILWRKEPSEPLSKFELNTVTYGLSCAPFLALRTLAQLSSDEASSFPKAAAVLSRDVYVDDIVTGANTLCEGLELRNQLIKMLERGGFKLSKWKSNVKELVPDYNVVEEPWTVSDSEDSGTRILGIQWNPIDDTLSYRVISPPSNFTKRGILSVVAKIYDPLGYLSPLILGAKSLLQELWAASLDWDEYIGDGRKQKWSSFCEHLPLLAQISIPRQLFPKDSHHFKLIGFADASEKGYSATFYIRSGDQAPYQSRLLIAKTKVAPLKSVSIPRLELCAAHLLSRLAISLRPFLGTLSGNQSDPVFFTDSEIVLCWIRTPPHKLKTFVGNRVSKIASATSIDHWHHVPSQENPSDCSSRGLGPEELLHHPLWWNGPSWLCRSVDHWPMTQPTSQLLPEAEKEVKVVTLSSVEVAYPLDWCQRYSSYSQIFRITGWMMRFVHNSRRKDRRSGPLSSIEIEQAQKYLWKMVQAHYYGNKEWRKDLSNLHPFIDSEKLIRVGGRLRKASSLSYDQRHPILLPAKSHLTVTMVDYFHKLYLHPGPNLLQALIQLRFWIPSLRRLIRRRTYLCHVCFKTNANTKALTPIMGDLPDCRLAKDLVFSHVGVDFGGPFVMKTSNLRKSPTSKVYLCIFICMNIKAVHLEMVTSLSADAFLSALDRFMSRRGCPAVMYSDNGTNFTGAARKLDEFSKWWTSPENKTRILHHCGQKEISWKFNPPNSPHFGGIWEAAIKSAKSFLRKLVGDQSLTFEEWSTITSRIEAILNSRPLCPLSNSPEETDFLTPGHFLIGGHLLDTPKLSHLETPKNRLSRWELLRHLYQLFWRRWSQEYLSTLQTRTKWKHPTRNLTVGELVLIKAPNAPPMSWPMGRITAIHPGGDNVVRVVTLRVGNSELKRSVHNLVPFPKDDDNN